MSNESPYFSHYHPEFTFKLILLWEILQKMQIMGTPFDIEGGGDGSFWEKKKTKTNISPTGEVKKS